MAIRTVTISPARDGQFIDFTGTSRAERVVLEDDRFDNDFGVNLDLRGGNDEVVGDNVGGSAYASRGGTISAGDGNDLVRFVSDSVNRIDSGAGNDRIETESDFFAEVLGNAGNDAIDARSDEVFVDGGAGDDSIDASTIGESIRLLGGDGNDRIASNFGSATLIDGGAGNDAIALDGTLSPNEANIFGGAGNDSIRYSSDPNDTDVGIDLFGGAGADRLFAGSFIDTLHFTAPNTPAGSGRDVVLGFDDGQDLLALDGDADRRAGGEQDYEFVGETTRVDAGEVGFFERGADTIVVGSDGRNRFEVELDRFGGELDAGDFLL